MREISRRTLRFTTSTLFKRSACVEPPVVREHIELGTVAKKCGLNKLVRESSYECIDSKLIELMNAGLAARKNEVRLTVQVAGLMIAFSLAFIYNVVNYILIQTGADGFMNQWKLLYPLMNAFFSCVQPWTCIFLNYDIQANNSMFTSNISAMTTVKL
ncbi:unnamed protein product [Cylicostephanus goldi]|uniref:Uncharacterized protein n=1 Tax=Cylicostephanus goldi TaxID=71465 RepID=A0A3P6RQU2_CYLGO|nr:unnamed protein product [Cylicostephanus goldi]